MPFSICSALAETVFLSIITQYLTSRGVSSNLVKNQVILQILKQKKLSQAKLAQQSNIHPAYLSRVLKNNTGENFSEDQLFNICEILLIADNLRNYLFLLLRYQKASYHKLKSSLNKNIKEIQAKQLAIKTRIEDTAIKKITNKNIENFHLEYFKNWVYTDVYLLLSLENTKKIQI